MDKQLLIAVALTTSLYASASEVLVSPPEEGVRYEHVYGSSANSFLLSQGMAGKIANDGYDTQMVINGKDVYIHSMITEYYLPDPSGLTQIRPDYWIHGVINDDNTMVEFTFPQQVDKDTHIEMLKPELDDPVNPTAYNLVPDTENPTLRMSWDGKTMKQIVPPAVHDKLPHYAGLVGLVNENGDYLAYGEQGLSYTIWDQNILHIPDGLDVVSYTCNYKDEWKSDKTLRVNIAIDGNDVYMSGISPYIQEAAIKGYTSDGGNTIVFQPAQFMGIYQGYYTFFFGAVDKEVIGDYPIDLGTTATLTLTESDYIGTSMAINIGVQSLYLGEAIVRPEFYRISQGEQIPSDPEVLEPWEFDESEGAGIFDFEHYAVDTQGQALDADKLFYNIYINDNLYTFTPEKDFVANEMTDIPFGYTDPSQTIYSVDGYHMIVFYENIDKIGVQAIYRDGDNETRSKLVEYVFHVGVEDIAADSPVVRTEYYDMRGVRIAQPAGLCIRRDVRADGTYSVRKIAARNF